jgi:hypothetical protein
MATTVLTLDLYCYEDLPEDAKDRAIEAWREVLYNGWDSHDVEMVTDGEYWREKMQEIGFTLGLRGKNEDDVYWDTNPLDLAFSATVDVPVFMRSRKMAGKNRAIYNAALRGEVGAEITLDHARYGIPRGEVEAEYNGEHCDDWRYINGEVIRGRNLAPIMAQLHTLEEAIKTAYASLCRDWVRSIDDAQTYHFSDEAIKEQLTDFYADILFREDGALHR